VSLAGAPAALAGNRRYVQGMDGRYREQAEGTGNRRSLE
jgi:hypothetical protein